MPSLRELQSAMRSRLADDADPAATALLTEALTKADRLSIYRNTSRIALTNALRLNYPAVQLLVGEDFFATAADLFITNKAPRTAWLDVYGAEFPEFLENFAPAASLRYLPDVARLERAVGRALHADDADSLTLSRLGKLMPADQARLCFVPHPAVSLISSDYPIDAIWRAVLACNDAAIAAVDLGAGPVWLLVERNASGIEVRRIDEQRWRFAEALFAGRPLAAALETAHSSDAPAWLAVHFAAGHFASFTVAETANAPAIPEHRQ